MKMSSMLIAGLFAVAGTSAFAQGAVDQVRQDNAQIRHDSKEIRSETHEVHHDTRALAQEKKEVIADKQKLQEDRVQRNLDQHAENAAIKRGDVVTAKKMDQARRAEQHAIHAEKRDIKTDHQQAAALRIDRHASLVARNDERQARRADVHKRNADASKVQ